MRADCHDGHGCRRSLGVGAVKGGGRHARQLAALAALAVCTACAPTPAVPTPAVTALSVMHPIPSVTPGTVLTSSSQDVCTGGWATQHRGSLSSAQKLRILKAYGLPVDTKVAEWDHLVSLELGGDNGTQNIWPQVSVSDKSRKDALENRMHSDVCAGKLTLPVAQERIRQYWMWW